MKKRFAFLLALLMLVSMPIAVSATGSTRTLYFENTDGWSEVYCWFYPATTSWPGEQMTQVPGTSVYQLVLTGSNDYKMVTFSNGGAQATAPLFLPLGEENFYSPSSQAWSLYSPSGAQTNTGASNTGFDVVGNYSAGNQSAPVLSVDIAWESMAFTYTEGVKGRWDPQNHVYTGVGTGAWSTNRPELTVTNHSDAGIVVDFAFTVAVGAPVKGSFYANSGSTSALSEEERSVTLATAEGTTPESAPSGSLCFGISGDALTATRSLGTVTVTVSQDRTRYVTTVAQLYDAMRTDGSIKLMNDIQMADAGTEYFEPASNTTITLDLNGKTLTAILNIQPNTVLKIKNGTVQYPTSSTSYTGGQLTLQNCTVVNGGFTNSNSNDAVLTFSGNIRIDGDIVKYGGSIIALAGTYNFDPTAYVDANAFTVTANDAANPTSWIVTAK